MEQNIFERLNRSSTSCIFLPLSNANKTLSDLNLICEKILNRKFNLQDDANLTLLEKDEIKNLLDGFENKFQKKLKLIFKPVVKNCLKNIFVKEDYMNFRVGIQIKYKWPKSHSILKNKLLVDDNGLWRENAILPNFFFPTRMHQDLSNNGFRGSGILIFYFQISKISKKTSNLKFYDFKKKIGILPYSNKYNYGNEIIKKSFKKKSLTPRMLNFENLCIMDPYAAHSSSSTSEIPRIAFNIKIQPSNYKFIIKNFNKFKKENKNLSDIKKIGNFYNIFNKISKKNNRFNFEAAILAKIMNKNKICKKHLSKLFLFKPTKRNYEDFLIGAFLKKTSVMIKNEDRVTIKKKIPIVKLSCAYNLLNTINIKMNYLNF